VTEDVFRPDSHVLEINSKSGLYPLYVAYNIYRSRVEAAKEKYGEVGHGFAMQLWDATIEENILVVCKTPMARSITKRTLAGFRNTRVNAQYYPNLIENISEKPNLVVNTFRDGKRFWKINQDETMKIDAIVGNPPYQVMDGGAGASAQPIYQYFVDLAKRISPKYISMITPSRWFAGGKGLDGFREVMLKDKRIKLLVDYPNAKDCFPGASIGGGVSYLLLDSKHNGPCVIVNKQGKSISVLERDLNQYDIFVRFNKAIQIIEKVRKLRENTISKIVSSRNPFGLSSSTRGSGKKDTNSYMLITSGGNYYIDKKKVIQGKSLIDKYKILISKVTCEHAGEPDKDGKFRVISRMEIILPYSVSTDSYLIIGEHEDESYVTNELKYLKTMFARFLILQAISSINLSKEKFQFVPLQDFTENSDIDWSKPISEIDKQLYKKYDLTEDEISFIESMIKPM
jgi:hypothetical protein